MNRSGLIIATLVLLFVSHGVRAAIMLPGLEAPVTVIRDTNGIPHIYADSEHDLFFMQGRVHAEDRLFQMDVLRRSADGTLAELFGTPALAGDIQARTIGLHRAAVRSLAAHPVEMQALLQAYADGVNSLIDQAEAAGQLPPEYAGLGLATVRRWTPLDSALVGKALAAATSLLVADDIDLTVALGTYQAIGDASGLFDGTALFFEDLFRNAPFDPASTVPDALDGFTTSAATAVSGKFESQARGKALQQGRKYRETIRNLPKIPGALRHDGGGMGGSNTWVVGGQHTPTGEPMLANDIHLALESPTIFHEQHLVAPGLAVTGSTLPGAPCVVRGHNESIAWGITNARLDITDLYFEVIVQDPASPNDLLTLHLDGQGNLSQEPILPLLETFYANVSGVLQPVATQTVLIVPRRNNGPLITAPEPANDPSLPPGAQTALSVQSVGFGPTRDVEGICNLGRAQNLDEFKAALQLIDFASQNFSYADKQGNIGYFISGELPLREDLQAINPQNPLTGPITPPFLIRNGFTGNEWMPLGGSQPADQATPFGILPFDEMPQVVNPPSGIIVNANNDQVGNSLDNNPLNDPRAGFNGLRYLNWGGRNFSIRAGRITELINARLNQGKGNSKPKKIAFGHLKRMQADTVLNDARALMPYILGAYENGTGGGAHPVLAAIAADPRIGEAIARFSNWDFTTPTGIPEGYDADPEEVDVDASVAATIYAVWRNQILANTIDATLDGLGQLAEIPDMPRPENREELVTALKHLLEHDGVGVSGLNFFNVPGIADPALRRDIVVLVSLAQSLELLASDAFAPAFANSTAQDDYRWGKLHRRVFAHPLGAVEPNFNVPPAFGQFPSPLPGLAGLPTDGGYETVDEAPPEVRTNDSDSFMAVFGPTGRFVARVGARGVKAETSLPGGESGLPWSPFYINLLEPWLRNETFRMLTSRQAIIENAVSIQEFVPGAP